MAPHGALRRRAQPWLAAWGRHSRGWRQAALRRRAAVRSTANRSAVGSTTALRPGEISAARAARDKSASSRSPAHCPRSFAADTMRRKRRKDVEPGAPVTRSIHRLMPPSKHDGSARQRSEFAGPKCPDGHRVDISSAKRTSPTGTYMCVGTGATCPPRARHSGLSTREMSTSCSVIVARRCPLPPRASARKRIRLRVQRFPLMLKTTTHSIWDQRQAGSR